MNDLCAATMLFYLFLFYTSGYFVSFCLCFGFLTEFDREYGIEDSELNYIRASNWACFSWFVAPVLVFTSLARRKKIYWRWS